jgi:hypothetical protein
MPELTTENLKDELQKMFDNSGGVFYKSGESEAILTVEPNKTPYDSTKFMIHAIVASIIFMFIINLSEIINSYLFLKPTVKIGLKYGPKYNIAPVFIVYLLYTFIVASLFMLSGSKIDNIFYFWGTFYLLVQFYLLMSFNLQNINIVQYDYTNLLYYVFVLIRCVKGNYKMFLLKALLYLSAITATILFINKTWSDSSNIPSIFIYFFMGILSSVGILPWITGTGI